MSWIEITLPTPELILKSDGTIEWNSGLQLLMGDPVWVDIMWDAAARTLGIRAVNSATGYPVEKEPKSGEYTIDSAESLARR